MLSPNSENIAAKEHTITLDNEEQQEKDRLWREGGQELDVLKRKSLELLKVREMLDKQEQESRQ